MTVLWIFTEIEIAAIALCVNLRASDAAFLGAITVKAAFRRKLHGKFPRSTNAVIASETNSPFDTGGPLTRLVHVLKYN